ncbi:DNA-binding transcriptional activator MhpR [Yersinia frederiksenii]|uniref:DNA-binding transcriptional activator MhpR n=2 Tax=Yersinia frederiksenii TaxID=29484 RepID=A0A380PUK4_YERFR|nr:helix-turn-helix domain-containing protein [Yersinia frederiksenii]ATM94557.1 IclR family transcriptional regulator [Yersinia frederiksenii]EEQ16291.1 Transcriptional regulator [Yersinia frederiksenii ATCC 33641]KGA48516.1 iclR helix-turn-helix domain protein [Yersinia frederiksenii ATCC 33641]MDN0120078.1 helix-turn-helix domain-containing protein [Yersinia frederiksenii]CFR06978.1 DNA-binding transcriptional activator MhpR [Yersinia frederiksenii]
MTEAQGINSVDIAVSVLESVTALGGTARAADIARMSGLSKSRLHKYLVSLCRCQMLYQDRATSRYSLGSKLLALASVAEKQNTLLTIINNALCELRDELNYSTGLVIRQGEHLLLTNYNRSYKNIDIDYLGNTPVPLCSSAAGWVFMAFDSSLAVQPNVDPAALEKVRRQGYAVRYHATEGIPGARAISCPIFSQSRKLLGAATTMGFIPAEETEIVRLASCLTAKVRALQL